VDALFGGKKKKKKDEEAMIAALEAEKASQYLTLPILGEVEKEVFVPVAFWTTYVVLLSFTIHLLTAGNKSRKGNRADDPNTLDVVLVGSGLPKKGMVRVFLNFL